MRTTLTANGAHCNQNQRPAPCRTLGDNAPPPMVPQTSPQWRHSPGSERTKAALSVIAASNCASARTARASGRTHRTSARKPPTAKMTVSDSDECAGQRRQFVRTAKTLSWQRIWLTAWLPLLLTALDSGTHFVTCSSAYEQRRIGTVPQLTAYPRSTLPDSPMTTQNDLITTDPNSTALLTAQKPTTTATTTATTTTASTTGYWSTTLGMSSAAPTITRNATGRLARGAVDVAAKSAQIGLTTQPATAAEIQTTTDSTTATATRTTTTTTMTTTMSTAMALFISTIYPTSTTERAMAAPPALTEAEASNSIETATSRPPEQEAEAEAEAEVEENAVLQHPHPANADSLTKGFSIPTFLPPFPVFAAADLPAYRAAAAAAAAAEAEAAAAAAAATSTPAAETVTLSPAQQRQQMFNEQHSYLASHNGQLLPGQQPRRNLTMPVLNITAQMGNHAYMPCQIHRLSEKPVSWVRLVDGHIISVDETTFIADERFQSIYQEDNDYTWSLQIKYVSPSDAGWYECQMATEPKLSAKVYLEVITPKTELIGDQSRFVKAGSKVALHCIVRGTLDPPKYIIWFRGQKKISESDERTGWYTQIDRNIFGTVGDNQNTIGSLIIPFVRKEDSGNYTCQPSNSESVSVDLHVLSGEYSASAIMSGAAERKQRSTFQLLLASPLLLALLAEALEVLAGLGARQGT
ncbi:PREDICTED: mucin-5AC isoform X1 [Drosophila arizonae]|uniref:Mucin-5AC isoform X1 n=1 Tax=Drosophila arizonae TaxID=7263 RepID=A0ABM1NNA0_DROAR|nr:PREDICTED: mucin-5AC isoform X1 [Drosophila arizonae]